MDKETKKVLFDIQLKNAVDLMGGELKFYSLSDYTGKRQYKIEILFDE